MIEGNKNEYRPDVVSPPGETLQELLEERGITQAALADRTGRPKKTINEIVKGKAAITPETALQFELTLGVPAAFWNTREQHYREYLARRHQGVQLKAMTGWLKEVPFTAMAKLGWIEGEARAVERVRALLRFFGVASVEQWREVYERPLATFRRSPKVKGRPGAIAAWLRKGELEAQGIACRAYDRDRFKAALSSVRELTRLSPKAFVPELVALCADAGVAVVFVPELPGMGVSGATRWLSSTKALIQLSLRYKSDDHLWFTFFHEAGHVVLHGKKTVFLEGNGDDDAKEQEANRFSADMLIPPAELQGFLSERDTRLSSIEAFAEKVGLAPGIVIGRLQHEGVIDYRVGNGLKQRLDLETTAG